jgi:hydroxyacylglutathione hydrolase
MTLYLKQIEIGPLRNFVYLIGDKEGKECAVVDPAWDVPLILREAEKDGMTISKILITHGHPDHTNGIEEILGKTKAKVYIQKKEAEWLAWKNSDIVKLESGDSLEIGKIRLKTIHTPGHTPGSQCFLLENALVSGDVLFVDSCGRVDLPGGDPKAMYESLMKLKSLEDETILYPGHNYGETPTSTLESQKKNNPYLRFASLESFLDVMGGHVQHWAL